MFLIMWMLALITVIGVNIVTKKSYTFVGETDSKEVTINSNYPVIIKNINIMSGQFVKKGQLLLELERPELEKKISEYVHKINEIQTELSINEGLTETIKSIKIGKKEVESPLAIQLKSLKYQLGILEKEKNELYIFASFDGHIGSVNYKRGESVSPFTPIVTMHNKTPSFVRGYIHENIANGVIEDAVVEITTMTSNKGIQGKVSSIGTRIIELPERFRRSESEKIWGREVMVRLPESNELLLGEKVFLEVKENPTKVKKRSIADSVENLDEQVIEMTIPKSILKKEKIEPSGIVYIKELNKYLVVSDDTYKNKPTIFIMDRYGNISKDKIKVKGLNKIKDVESITEDEEGYIYILSSLSVDKNGEIPKARRKLVKIKRTGLKLEMIGEVDLLSVILGHVKEATPPWHSFVSNENEVVLDIEGMSIRDNELLLGLRNSVGRDNQVAVLSIKNLNSLFSSLDKVDVELRNHYILPVASEQDLNEGISDLFWVGDTLHIVTASNKGKNRGRILQVTSSGISVLREFNNNKPEGGTYNSTDNEYVIVFDDNSKIGHMTRFYER